MTQKNKNRLSLLKTVLFALLFSFFGSPSTLGARDLEDSFMSVTDSFGREVQVPKDPQRILPLTTASTELIRIMGAMDRVVGTTSIVKTREDLFPEIIKLPDVGRGFTPNLEVLVRLDPDLVITWCDYPGPELEGLLEPLGIKVLRLDIMHPKDFFRETRVLASILGGDAPERGENFLAWYGELENSLQESIVKSGLAKPTVLVEQPSSPGVLVGRPSGIYGTTEEAGGENLASFITLRSAEVDIEWILRADPDFYLKVFRSSGIGPTEEGSRIMDEMREEIINRKGWENLRAIREGNVHVLDADLCGGPRNIVGVYTVAQWFYPELVPQEKAGAIRAEYLQKFLNISD
ncbi:MAG: ABC transporter substrate-binding protein [Deltaproteobacteria bacterium]|jgi:iron complex transport system substrate-binding protein|nr:ABC transporter substrate-binding protein [Deltaproteobacteria bacterium]